MLKGWTHAAVQHFVRTNVESSSITLKGGSQSVSHLEDKLEPLGLVLLARAAVSPIRLSDGKAVPVAHHQSGDVSPVDGDRVLRRERRERVKRKREGCSRGENKETRSHKSRPSSAIKPGRRYRPPHARPRLSRLASRSGGCGPVGQATEINEE